MYVKTHIIRACSYDSVAVSTGPTETYKLHMTHARDAEVI